MREHFKADPTPDTKSLTKEELKTTDATRNDLIESNLDEGFDLTDTNANSEVSREEDVSANMIANEFTGIDTNDNDNLSKMELNKQFPMWQVDKILDEFDSEAPRDLTDAEKADKKAKEDAGETYTMPTLENVKSDDLDIIEFAKFYNSKWSDDDKCTK
jgi:hypothetical protein